MMASVSPVVTRAGHAGFGLGVTARLAPCSRTVVTRRTAVPSSLLRLPGRRTLSGGIVRPLPVYDAAWAGHTVGMHSMAAKRVVRRTVAQRIAAIPATYPLAFGAVFTCSKTLAADSFVQLVLEKKEELDLRRLAVFGVFGFVWMGGFQYFFYARLLTSLFPRAAAFAAKPMRAKLRDRAGIASVFGQLFVEQALYTPFVFYPVYYITKTAINGDREQMEAAGQGVVEYALRQCRANFADDWKATAAIFIPGNAFNYTFMPMHMRIPFLATLSFGYCILLSMTRGDEKAGSVQVEAVEASENVEAEPGTPIVGVTDLHVLPGDTADVTRHVVEFRPRVQVVRSTHS